MSENNVVEIKKRGTNTDDALTEMLKTGAQQLIHQAVQAGTGDTDWNWFCSSEDTKSTL